MIWKVDTATVPRLLSLELDAVSWQIEFAHRTSGDSSDRIIAPLVSTWMTFARGRDGDTAVAIVAEADY